jgi:hypothetical protein
MSSIREHVDLERITVPTLIINGELDEILDTSDLAEITCAMPCAQAMLVPGAGHFLHQEEGRAHLHALYRPFLRGEMQVTSGVTFVHQAPASRPQAGERAPRLSTPPPGKGQAAREILRAAEHAGVGGALPRPARLGSPCYRPVAGGARALLVGGEDHNELHACCRSL